MGIFMLTIETAFVIYLLGPFSMLAKDLQCFVLDCNRLYNIKIFIKSCAISCSWEVVYAKLQSLLLRMIRKQPLVVPQG